MPTGAIASIVVAYALFRMFEYFSLKNFQALIADGVHPGNRTALNVFTIVLWPARVGGWALLIWLAFKIGIMGTLGVLIVAFFLSLLLQITVGTMLMVVLGPLSGLVCLAAVPILGILIALLIAAL